MSGKEAAHLASPSWTSRRAERRFGYLQGLGWQGTDGVRGRRVDGKAPCAARVACQQRMLPGAKSSHQARQYQRRLYQLDLNEVTAISCQREACLSARLPSEPVEAAAAGLLRARGRLLTRCAKRAPRNGRLAFAALRPARPPPIRNSATPRPLSRRQSHLPPS